MAKSKYEYVKIFEKSTELELLAECYLVVRIDGKGFHKFTVDHEFEKPNDENGLKLMNRAAMDTFKTFQDILISFVRFLIFLFCEKYT